MLALGDETAGPASPSVLPDVACEPTVPGGCIACFDEDLDQTFCSMTGFKREVKCVSSALVNDNASASETGISEVRQRESYLAFQGCSPEPTNTFGAVVKFELLMAVLFAISFSFATKRKRKLLAIQHHRIAQYLS
mmetsp:Transcript_1814/g.3576  ORF Transcript_1814/g.3576 Transcript_1814/m.3576 type:complete len:136 (-) Transcript_1814:164-571(-)